MALDETAIRHLVLTELARQGSKFVPVGISARHVHLTTQDIEKLFGPGYQLTPLKPIVQPGQYASQEQLTLVGPKGSIEKVRILGPARPYTQIELAFTDALKLGIRDCPIRMSGDIQGTPGLKLVGPKGELEVPQGVIVAARHLHFTDEQAKAYGVHDKQVVAVRVTGPRPCLLENVVCRVGAAHELEVHIDTDEANACALKNGDLLELVFPGQPEAHHCQGTCHNGGGCTCGHSHGTCAPAPAPQQPPEPEQEPLDLVTERDINDAFRDNLSQVLCQKKALITPAAADRAAETGIKIVRV